MNRRAQKRSDKRQAERAAEHRRREKENRERDREPKPPADEKATPSKQWPDWWADKTAEHQGEAITIIGAPRPPKRGA